MAVSVGFVGSLLLGLDMSVFAFRKCRSLILWLDKDVDFLRVFEWTPLYGAVADLPRTAFCQTRHAPLHQHQVTSDQTLRRFD